MVFKNESYPCTVTSLASYMLDPSSGFVKEDMLNCWFFTLLLYTYTNALYTRSLIHCIKRQRSFQYDGRVIANVKTLVAQEIVIATWERRHQERVMTIKCFFPILRWASNDCMKQFAIDKCQHQIHGFGKILFYRTLVCEGVYDKNALYAHTLWMKN